MKKVEIVLSFGEEKLEYSLRKEKSNVQKKMNEALQNLYTQAVPEAVREYLDRKDAPARERPPACSKAKRKANRVSRDRQCSS